MFFKGKGVRAEHLNKKVEYIIEDFLVEGTINILYASPGIGKSSFSMGLIDYLSLKSNIYTSYFDYDNPIVMLSDRGMTSFIEKNNNSFDYIHPDIVLLESKEVLDKLVEDCRENDYSNTLLIFDSATDFCDETSDSSVKIFFRKLKILRNAGATIIVLHHTNKKDPSYKGSSIFRSASDNIFALSKEFLNENEDYMLLENKKARIGRVRDTAFILNRKDWSLRKVEFNEANIPKKERDFIDKILVSLEENEEIGQSKLLESIGLNKGDKKAIEYLNKFNNRYWQQIKPNGKTINYKKL